MSSSLKAILIQYIEEDCFSVLTTIPFFERLSPEIKSADIDLDLWADFDEIMEELSYAHMVDKNDDGYDVYIGRLIKEFNEIILRIIILLD